MTSRTVLTVGSAMIDTIAVIEDELIERMNMDNAGRSFLLLEEGSKTEASLISTHAGGGAINSAVAFARLGFQVETLVKCGRDQRAAAIRKALTDEGVSLERMIKTDKAATGASVHLAAHERNAAIFTFRGANGLIEPNDLTADAFARDVVYITGLSNRSAEVFPEIVALAARHRGFVAANPGIRQLRAGSPQFDGALKKLSLLSLNRAEAGALVPRLMQRHPKASLSFEVEQQESRALPDLLKRGFSTDGTTMQFMHFADALLASGPARVLITDGSRGSYAVSDGEIVFCPAVEGDVVGTAGAGDAYSATFAAMICEGKAVADAMVYAAINAASVVGHADTQTGLLRRADLEQRRKQLCRTISTRSWRFGNASRASSRTRARTAEDGGRS